MTIDNFHYITPNWPAPPNVRAYTRVRQGGFSVPPFASFNSSYYVGDEPEAVTRNRAQLIQELELPCMPLLPKQVHSNLALSADILRQVEQEADAVYTHRANVPCGVLTADCLPLLVCNRTGTHVAAIHAGWRGLAEGVIEATLQALQQPASELLVWLGPAIGPQAFLVGPEVREIFLARDAAAESAFTYVKDQQWLADLYLLAKLRLANCGILESYGGEYCTYSDAARFYSYRRDGAQTGRMISLIWRT